MVDIRREALQAVRDRESLFAFLSDELKWPVTPEDTYTYEVKLTGRAATRADVSQIVPFSSGDPFVIMLAEFKAEMRRADLREILREIRARIRKEAAFEGRGLEEIVFVCATQGYNGVRFAHFKEQEGRQPKLSVFGWDASAVDETRTLRAINLPALHMPKKDMFAAWEWAEARPRWMEAWNIEAVTNKFYTAYKRIFEDAEQLIEGIGDQDDLRLFTQKLFNRLLFIRFMEKKGWLTFGGRRDYLCALWEDYQAKRREGEDFYTSRLKLLFFSGLNNEQEANLMVINGGGVLADLIGEVPYLNGGLFDEQEDEEQNDAYPDIRVPDEAIEPLVTVLFYAFNFTVTESTPDDVEVAVDPEMLGKVFEELVTGRHESGSYYTPKNVVSFMCREALKGYLRHAVPAESDEAVEGFVELRDSEGLKDPEAVLAALQTIKVCDPACGSGAYLLGMLHELIDLRHSLFRSRSLDPSSLYEKKLQVIEQSVYGVDLDPFAVNIARLRLWLSLTVEYEGAKPEPLPNLDFKIEQGNSVVGPKPESGTDTSDMFRRPDVERLVELKARYLETHGTEKVGLRESIQGLQKDIAAGQAGVTKGVKGFYWSVEFAEVFFAGGFDVVLANPPYIRQELIKEQKPDLKAFYGELYCGTADLYVYFYLRGLQLLKPGGMLAFISSNKWFRAKYGENLRKYVAESCSVRSITDFGELPVFKTAATFPMIFVAQKGKCEAPTRFTQVKTLDPPYPDVLALARSEGQTLPDGAISGGNWMLTDAVSADRLRKMEKAGTPLGEYVNGAIYYGIKTGFNEAFVIDAAKRDELIARDPRSAEVIKPLIVGDDVRKWHIRARDRWLIVTPIGVDMKRYPAVFAHLKRWQKDLEERWDKGDQWWELRACAYYAEFGKPKIVYPEIAMEPRFTLDRAGKYPIKTIFSIPGGTEYLLGVMNSASAWAYLKGMCSVLGDADERGRLTLQEIYVSKLPIPEASDIEKKAISRLVRKCLDAEGVGCEEWEREIDERVAALYGL